MTPTIYRYHPKTGQYLGSGEADPSPLEPGVWLYPAHSTDIAPPAEQAGFVRVWDGGQWQQQAIPGPEPEPEPEPLPPQPDWDGFNAWILADAAFNSVYNTAVGNGAIAQANALFVAYSQVSTGNLATFTLAFNAVCAAGGATQTQRNAWAIQADECNLPESFAAVIQGT